MTRDAILSVTNRTTGEEVIRVDLADFLSRLRTSRTTAIPPRNFSTADTTIN